MNEAHLPAFAALLLGVLAGPLIWWLGRKVLRFVAWQLEFGKAWLPDLAEQDLACPGCAKKFAPNESKCLECGKSREVAYYASLREVDIAEEQVVRLSQMGVVEPDTAMRMEEGLLRQKNALARLRKPQKTPNSKVEWVLPGGEPITLSSPHCRLASFIGWPFLLASRSLFPRKYPGPDPGLGRIVDRLGAHVGWVLQPSLWQGL